MNAKEARWNSWLVAYGKAKNAISGAISNGVMVAEIDTNELGCWVQKVITKLEKEGYVVKHDKIEHKLDDIMAKHTNLTSRLMNEVIKKQNIDLRDKLIITF
jgi:tRNA uridine 5-carbamoylmethylation protein Kti12